MLKIILIIILAHNIIVTSSNSTIQDWIVNIVLAFITVLLFIDSGRKMLNKGIKFIIFLLALFAVLMKFGIIDIGL